MSDYQDEHAGRGGSYVIGADGKRVLQQRTGHVVPEVQQAEPTTPAKTTKQVKGAANAKSN